MKKSKVNQSSDIESDSKIKKQALTNQNKKLLSEISKLSYEQSLEKLDIIIANLQNENFLIEELQENYLKASFYLEHCENLLENIEQTIIEIDLNKFKSKRKD